MHRKPVTCLLALLFVLAVLPPVRADTGFARDALIGRMLDRVNAFREEQGLGALRLNERISVAAQEHSETMLERQCFAHACDGEADLGRRLERAGYRYRVASENIAAGFTSPEKVVEQWIRSDSHRDNMLIPELTEAGVGYVRIPRAADPMELGTYWTLDLGALRGRRSPPPKPVRRPEREMVRGPGVEREPEISRESGSRPGAEPSGGADPAAAAAAATAPAAAHPMLTPPPAWIGRAQPIRRDR